MSVAVQSGVTWVYNGQVRRKSMEPYIKDEVVYYRHQVAGVRQLARQKSFILADDMGLGKSLQALTLFAVDILRGFCESAIVVCPAGLKGNWADEIEKHTGIQYQVVGKLTPKKRQDQIEAFRMMVGPKILIVNYEQVLPHLAYLNSLRADIAIFDEAHMMKNGRAQRTKACHKLYSRRSFLLTGTPILNRVNELWSLLHRCDPKRFSSYWNFTHRYCVFGGYNNKEIIGVKNEAELKGIINEFVLQRFKKDVLDLPEVQIIERRVDLLPEQQKMYDEVANDLKLTVIGETEAQDVENGLTKFLRLKQICGTTHQFNGEDISSKLDLAVEDDFELMARGEKVVVFTQFRAVQFCHANRLRALGLDVWDITGDTPTDRRSEIVKEWAASPRAGALVCMLQVAGVGLNMTAAKHGSLLDLLFVPGLNKQAIDRLHRIGASSSQPVQFRKYICRNTVENRVNQILSGKEALTTNILGGTEVANFKRKILAAMKEDLSHA